MLIVLNGYPGVGKLTIGQILAERLQGRLLDNHTVYNPAFALTTFKSPAFYDAVRAMQVLTDDLIGRLDARIPLVLTETLAGSAPWGDECWKRIEKLGRIRGPFYVVHLLCDPEENVRRIQEPGRESKRKPRDAEMALRNHKDGYRLYGDDAKNLLRLDVTDLSPDKAATEVHNWIASQG
ncbi:AAA family ATPase [Cognatiyoonia sp. IB215182]|uniref:AAA family ATPase n=1 Tax=Cognatiyoonia sp. IB215182 TaxID=3097353 RepID=UPI002A0D7DDF|nr:AAA family ATPase [Cognatiyoonia sp. IB215182]MDX8352037.1 AAA family ATPase [Cognatiyoonia sp. IB215182]